MRVRRGSRFQGLGFMWSDWVTGGGGRARGAREDQTGVVEVGGRGVRTEAGFGLTGREKRGGMVGTRDW